MALPELLKVAVEKKLAEYCGKNLPVHVSDQFRLGFRLRGNNVTLFKSRPFHADPSRWVENFVAQFRFDPETAVWTLYWPDRNSRWHNCVNLEPSRQFEKLLHEVDEDPAGIFWE